MVYKIQSLTRAKTSALVADARFQLIKGRMRAPDPGETNAHIYDKDVEQPLRSSRWAALFRVSYYLSRGVYSDKRCHNEHSSSLDKQDNGDTSALVMQYEMPPRQVQLPCRAG
jgi:hypothetical protein